MAIENILERIKKAALKCVILKRSVFVKNKWMISLFLISKKSDKILTASYKIEIFPTRNVT